MPAKRRARSRPQSGYPALVPLKGRQGELDTLVGLLVRDPKRRVALVGAGGTGKSLLANALGHRLRARYPGGIHWFRSGPWDARTLAQMLCVRFGVPLSGAQVFSRLRALFAERGPTFIVLDNHENDTAACRLFNELSDATVTWVLTARRCLLAGVYVFPVVAPQVTTGRTAFPRVHALAHVLRHSPLALDMADAIVGSRAASAGALRRWLLARGVGRVRVIMHEDDLPEVSLLVAWHWARLAPTERRTLAVLAHSEGDHMDADSVAALADLPLRAGHRAIERLVASRLVQTPLPGRYALHAVVRYAVAQRTRCSRRKLAKYYLDLLERQPDRLDLDQTHLYAAMDVAHDASLLDWMLRIERLLDRLANLGAADPNESLGERTSRLSRGLGHSPDRQAVRKRSGRGPRSWVANQTRPDVPRERVRLAGETPPLGSDDHLGRLGRHSG